MSEIKPILSALTRSKTGAILLVMQIAITLALVSNAMSIVADRAEKINQTTGYDEQGIISYTLLTYDKDTDIPKQFKEDIRQLKALDGVIDALAVSSIPLSRSGGSRTLSTDPEEHSGKTADSGYIRANHHVIGALGLTINEGRDFAQSDVIYGRDGDYPSVGIVSREVADKLFGKGNGLNETVYSGDDAFKIIGIIDTLKSQWPRSKMGNSLIFLPIEEALTYQKFIVKTTPQKRAQVIKQIEPLLLDLDRGRVVMNIKGLDTSKADTYAGDTLMIRMLIAIVVFLVIITALGIFGLTHFNISKRTKQIGTRRALGARKSTIFKYFLLENLLVTALGVVIGGVGALVLGRELMGHYSVPPLETSAVLITAMMMLLMSFIAVYSPARRAANISPSVATRSI
ncbi:ABC transporter permease [Pseudoalteromonas obscura]|uniref:FtsX-like permease family protein n=1 Tax=Pseudoalteromonas obscura TaxID=3048491 RepID=A0ABT7EKD2_9GAMM|nr:FtsX-like permease family protein [Pseudoalteromonas sp. P94(2023)]MDK2595476.1 FtsX-like permease family protein [Pseudoalteromonas sp. P94(2023)]